MSRNRKSLRHNYLRIFAKNRVQAKRQLGEFHRRLEGLRKIKKKEKIRICLRFITFGSFSSIDVYTYAIKVYLFLEYAPYLNTPPNHNIYE